MNRTANNKFRIVAAGVLTLAVVGAGATSAEAKGREVIRTGGCDNSSAVWKLKAKADNGKIEVEFEVDSNKVGQTWSVRMGDNGHRFYTGTRTTKAPSGSFSVARVISNRVGTDQIRARATRGTATCAASVNF